MTDSGFQPDDAIAVVEASTTPSPAQMPQQRPAQPAAASEGDDDQGDDFTDIHAARKIRSENRSLRGRLRDSEVQRDGLQVVVDGLRRGEVERLAAVELHDARDLLDRHQLDEFLDESGNVDPTKVSAAACTLIADRPHTAAPPAVTKPPTDRPIEGLIPGASPQRNTQETTWASALGPLVR